MLHSFRFILIVSVYLGLGIYLLNEMLKPLLKELQRTRETLEYQLVELRKDLRIRHEEAARIAYFEKYGVYPDHWKAAASTEPE